MNTSYSIESVVDLTLAKFGTELNSGSIAKAVNTALLVLEVKQTETGADGKTEVKDYQVTPQMMNNYGKNGMFDKVKRDSMANVVFSVTDIRAWMIKFLTNKANGIVTRGGGIAAAELAEAVKAQLAQPKKVIADDDATKAASAAPAAKAAPVSSKK
jgi:hypothetical protein